MIRPAPPASIALAAMIVAVTSAAASADAINLLRPATRPSPRIIIDFTNVPPDDAASRPDDECVAIRDEAGRAVHGSEVGWSRGRLSWEWAPQVRPAMVYLVCVDRGGTRSPERAGLSFGAPLSPFISWPAPILFDIPISAPMPAGSVISPSMDAGNTTPGPFVPPVLVVDVEHLTPVPEPAAWLLFGTGIALASRARRQARL